MQPFRCLRRARLLALIMALCAGCSAASQNASPSTEVPLTTQAEDTRPGQAVVLLHGLARSAGSMNPVADMLKKAGYQVCNVDYPSREHTVEVLAADYVLPAIQACLGDHPGPIDFVTHSMGGIIVRQLAATDAPLHIGRVVMLAPPNKGSDLVDQLGDWRLFKRLNGPAGEELGTGPDSLPNRLGPAQFPVGVIAGRQSINLILSLLIKGPDDGKVAIANTHLAGMRDFIVINATHPLIMRDDEALRQIRQFLATGCFIHDGTLPSGPDMPPICEPETATAAGGTW